MDSKMILGIIAAGISIVGYVFYYFKMFSRGGTKPCVFTWLPISIIIGFVLFAQIKTGANFGALVTGVIALNSISCTIISLLYFSKKQQAEWTDWICFSLAIIAIILWRTTSGLVLPVIIMCIADVISFFPSWQRCWKNPFGESLPMWTLSCIKMFFGILALQIYSVTTLLPHLTVAGINGIFALIIFTRRKFLKKQR